MRIKNNTVANNGIVVSGVDGINLNFGNNIEHQFRRTERRISPPAPSPIRYPHNAKVPDKPTRKDLYTSFNVHSMKISGIFDAKFNQTKLWSRL